MSLFCGGRRLTAGVIALVLPAMAGVATSAEATPALTMDLATGQVLYAHEAARPWYPASLTKLMTVYVALKAVRERRIALDTPLVVSARAAVMPPSKMGFAPGSEVTLDNALKMLMVKSANDLAITVAEGVSGSVAAFADEMNDAAASLGMRQSHFVNPNGLHDPQHYSSARDMAILARALYASFPDRADLFSIGALSLGGEIINNHNNLMGRYPGIDGMKTGFTCPAGFNVVATSARDGRRLAVIVMGGPSVALRTAQAAALLDRGFIGIDKPIGNLSEIVDSASGLPDPRNNVCRDRAKAAVAYNATTEQLMQPLKAMEAAPSSAAAVPRTLFDPTPLTRPAPVATRIAMVPTPAFDPIPVYVGPAPGYVGPVAQARPPHSPVGTEPVPETATAYADRPEGIGAATPLKPDVNALPLKGRGPVKTAKAKAAKPIKVAAHTPEAKPQPKKPVDPKVAKPVVSAQAGDKAHKGKAVHTAQRKPKDKADDHGE